MNLTLYNDISKKLGKGVSIKKSLCFYNPKEVYDGIVKNKIISDWHNFIITEYVPKKKKILLIYPCSTVKPYGESRSYKQLYNFLNKLSKKREQIQIMTISEPFGLVPEEYYEHFQWYDCPGLFEWWCNKHGQKFDENYLDKSIDLLANNVGIFLKRVQGGGCYEKIIGFVRTYSSNLKQKHDHTHRRILELAAEKYNIDLEILPYQNEVRDLIKERGKFAWDMYGVAHPVMLDGLIKKLGNY